MENGRGGGVGSDGDVKGREDGWTMYTYGMELYKLIFIGYQRKLDSGVQDLRIRRLEY